MHEKFACLPGAPARTLITATAGETVVAVSAELDRRSTDRLREVLAEETALGPPALIVDASGLTFCSVSGLEVLIDAARAAALAGVAFFVVAAQRAVLRPLRVLELDRELRVVERLADALEASAAAPTLAAEVG
ncbi:STAS domain-containing protein [Amycolatopsis rubida]|uniref:STAS domain-containing protein n=1 Tax=Amycolatopsis rubida TaxID=112413 RepID=A0ABX0BNG0_9PSEU|nr:MULTISPECIES: STAS domain-containing protein [Amycolatopsis]MYW89394.1 STAS domain-containing protein [Amycolatopsis rubida]NEC54371.1 STAS domain-containing protein [Amycolatopsis rubida]OAP21381.1 Anti-sigma-F factor antagonist RsfB [Amycolatopsis sp. M39]